MSLTYYFISTIGSRDLIFPFCFYIILFLIYFVLLHYVVKFVPITTYVSFILKKKLLFLLSFLQSY